MPMINVKLIEGVFDNDQKREMIEKLTDTMVSIEGENMRSVTWVVADVGACVPARRPVLGRDDRASARRRQRSAR